MTPVGDEENAVGCVERGEDNPVCRIVGGVGLKKYLGSKDLSTMA